MIYRHWQLLLNHLEQIYESNVTRKEMRRRRSKEIKVKKGTDKKFQLDVNLKKCEKQKMSKKE